MQGVLHKTLVIRLSSVGDIVLSSPLVRALHGRYPACQIDYCVKEEYADLVRYNPHLTRVVPFPTGGTPGDLHRLRRLISSSGYDLIIDIHDSIRSRYIAAGAPAVTRINKRKIARAILVALKRDVYDRFGGAPDVPARYLEAVRRWDVADDGLPPEIYFTAETASRAEALLEAGGIAPGARVIGLCPGARHGNKMWPGERFAACAASLAARHAMPVVLFGAEEEREKCAAIEAGIRAALPQAVTVNLAGRLSLLETAAAMDRCALVVTNDTGLMHIAAARRIPLVAVFGPTVRQFGFFPRGMKSTVVEHTGLGCRPCTHIGLPRCPEGHFRCMNDISAETVAEAAEKRMSA
ncbi:MAG TPA: lipopolysaccharide heptosyltransferase II [Bacteroidota bacterium]|nr:lipopolysaccharide heptosyltransferase II [Bacteroidota bacterium]